MKLSSALIFMVCGGALTLASSVAALEPPSREQIEKYVREGSFARRVAAAQIFDPSTESWTTTADLNDERQYQVAVGLVDDRVLVAGGYYSRTAEIFDPSTETWSLTEPLNGFHLGAAARVDSSGRVILAGGFDRNIIVVETVAVFEPEAGTWRSAAPMSTARYGHGLSRLIDGTLVVTGGTPTTETWPYPGSTSIEIFGPPEVSEDPRSPTRRLIPSAP